MKKDKKQLDVDFIGGEAPLTSAEEKLISDYLAAKKKDSNKLVRKTRIASKLQKKS